MAENSPFTPPESRLADPKNDKPGSQLKAVLIGVAIDLGGTLASSFIIGIFLGIIMSAQGLDMNAINTYASNPPFFSPYHLFGLLAGLLCSILGAYVCSRIAKQNEYGLAILMFILSSLVSFMLFGFGGGYYDVSTMLFLMILSLVAAIYGARLGREKNLGE